MSTVVPRRNSISAARLGALIGADNYGAQIVRRKLALLQSRETLAARRAQTDTLNGRVRREGALSEDMAGRARL